MRKNITVFLKEWLIYTLKWVVILAISFPVMSIFIGLLSLIFPTYENLGKQLLSLNSVINYLIKGVEIGFFAGFIFGGFSLMMSLGIKANKQ